MIILDLKNDIIHMQQYNVATIRVSFEANVYSRDIWWNGLNMTTWEKLNPNYVYIVSASDVKISVHILHVHLHIPQNNEGMYIWLHHRKSNIWDFRHNHYL